VRWCPLDVVVVPPATVVVLPPNVVVEPPSVVEGLQSRDFDAHIVERARGVQRHGHTRHVLHGFKLDDRQAAVAGLGNSILASDLP
jgi:hypothetical protein